MQHHNITRTEIKCSKSGRTGQRYTPNYRPLKDISRLLNWDRFGEINVNCKYENVRQKDD